MKQKVVFKSVGITFTIIFIKNISQIAEIAEIARLFTDHLKHKAVNKTTCRTPSANLDQLCTY